MGSGLGQGMDFDVGFRVGFGAGSRVGFMVGSRVGSTVGAKVESEVGSSEDLGEGAGVVCCAVSEIDSRKLDTVDCSVRSNERVWGRGKANSGGKQIHPA